MMFQETNQRIIFFFVDFGSSFRFKENSFSKPVSMPETYSEHFSPPEQNHLSQFYSISKQTYKSDIYSLSKSFSSILKSSKIALSSPIVTHLLKQMEQEEIEKRPTVDECFESLSSYYGTSFIEMKKKEYFHCKDFKFCKKFDYVSKYIKNMPCSSSIHSITPKFVPSIKESIDKNDKDQLIKQYQKIIKEKDLLIEELQKEIEFLKNNPKN